MSVPLNYAFSFTDIAELLILDNNDYVIADSAQHRLNSPQLESAKQPLATQATEPLSKDENELLALADTKANRATNITELYEIVTSSTEFDLEKIASNLCFFTPPPKQQKCDILILSDYPNTIEDKTGELFVGGNCEILDKMLNAANFMTLNIAKANLVFWRPLGGARPSQRQVNLCLPFVKQLINLLQPKILFLLGSIGLENLTSKKEAYILKNNMESCIITSYDIKNISTVTPHMAKHLWQAVLNIKTRLKS